jgi:ribose 5-phosphate isomerase A
MRLGLGTGSTAAMFVEALAERVAGGLKVVGVATSQATRRQAERLGITLVELDEAALDLTIDGADEIDPDLNLIKGGGGALTREKIVAASSRRMIVVADDAKQVQRLGRFPLPVEILPFGAASTVRRIGEAAGKMRRTGCEGSSRSSWPAAPGRRHCDHHRQWRNWIVDCHFGDIPAPAPAGASCLESRGPGRCRACVEHGLFVGLCSGAIIGTNRCPRRRDRRCGRSMSSYDYDLFVIGAGSGGVRAARVAAQHGARVAIAEEDRVGGTCVIRGCIPKKLFVYASAFREAFEDAQGYGWTVDKAAFDWPALLANKDREIDRLNKVYIAGLEAAGVELMADAPSSKMPIRSASAVTAAGSRRKPSSSPPAPCHLSIWGYRALSLPSPPTRPFTCLSCRGAS